MYRVFFPSPRDEGTVHVLVAWLFVYAVHVVFDYVLRDALGIPGFATVDGYMLWWFFVFVLTAFRTVPVLGRGAMVLAWAVCLWVDSGLLTLGDFLGWVTVDLERVFWSFVTVCLVRMVSWGREPSGLLAWLPSLLVWPYVYVAFDLGRGGFALAFLRGMGLLALAALYTWRPWVFEVYSAGRRGHVALACAVCGRTDWLKVGEVHRRLVGRGEAEEAFLRVVRLAQHGGWSTAIDLRDGSPVFICRHCVAGLRYAGRFALNEDEGELVRAWRWAYRPDLLEV